MPYEYTRGHAPVEGEKSLEGEKEVYVIKRVGPVMVMSDGTVVNRMEEFKKNQERTKKEIEDRLAELPKHEGNNEDGFYFDGSLEERREVEWLLDDLGNMEISEDFPIGGKINLIDTVPGDIDQIQTYMDMQEEYQKRKTEGRELRADGKDEEARKLREGGWEMESDLEKFARDAFNIGFDHDYYYVSDDAVQILQEGNEGEILYTESGTPGGLGDSHSLDLIVKIGEDTLFYKNETSEYGMGASFTLVTVKDIVDNHEGKFAGGE